ncbi:MAG TPA: DoxX family protein [Candidatus Nanoarchaeia archaeon]|nr:DoxX family protein [Candidatus Nanoarchaeia archaeon]
MAKNGKLNEWALALLRVVLGVLFTYHGYVKLFVPGGFKGTVAFFLAIGLPVPAYTALLVSVVEFFGGLALIVGLLTRWTSALLFVEMLVALFKVHLKNGFFIGSSYGYEFVLLLLASLAVVYACGAGNYAWGSKFKNAHLK